MYSWPRPRAASAISRIGEPPSDQSEWVWQSPRSAARNALAAAATGLPAPAAGASESAHGCASSRRRYTGSSPASDSATQRAVTSPMPLQLAQRAGGRLRPHLVRVEFGQHGRGVAEGPDPVARLVGALEQEGDAAQIGDRIAGQRASATSTTLAWRPLRHWWQAGAVDA